MGLGCASLSRNCSLLILQRQAQNFVRVTRSLRSRWRELVCRRVREANWKRKTDLWKMDIVASRPVVPHLRSATAIKTRRIDRPVKSAEFPSAFAIPEHNDPHSRSLLRQQKDKDRQNSTGPRVHLG